MDILSQPHHQACPHCRSAQSVYRVSALYAAGPLGAAFPPPYIPKHPRAWGFGSLFLVLGSLAAIAFAFYFYSFLLNPDGGDVMDEVRAASLAAAIALPAVATLLGVIIAKFFLIRRACTAYRATARAATIASTLYSQLFCCTRCQVVYWPGPLTPAYPKTPIFNTDLGFGHRPFSIGAYWTTLWAASHSLVSATDPRAFLRPA